MQIPKKRDRIRCPEGKRLLLACHTRCKRSVETIRNSAKVNLGIKVMKLVESLIYILFEFYILLLVRLLDVVLAFFF